MASLTQWDFFTNHAHVLIYLAKNDSRPLREVAYDVGITERAVQRIVADLEDAGYLRRERDGRRNRYQIHPELHFPHNLEAHCTIGELLELIVTNSSKQLVDADDDRILGSWTVGEHGSEVK